jgi:hypothetical protein
VNNSGPDSAPNSVYSPKCGSRASSFSCSKITFAASATLARAHPAQHLLSMIVGGAAGTDEGEDPDKGRVEELGAPGSVRHPFQVLGHRPRHIAARDEDAVLQRDRHCHEAHEFGRARVDADTHPLGFQTNQLWA